MSTPARVKSIEALDAFRASLLLYLEKAGRILDEARGDVVRTRTWLETDCRQQWQRRIRDRAKQLAQAEAELLTAKLSDHPEAIQDRRMTVNKLKHALEDAEAGMARVQRWLRHYQPDVESQTQVLLKLRQVFAHDMVKALAHLETAATTLADYADLAPPEPVATRAPPAADGPSAPGQNPRP